MLVNTPTMLSIFSAQKTGNIKAPQKSLLPEHNLALALIRQMGTEEECTERGIISE